MGYLSVTPRQTVLLAGEEASFGKLLRELLESELGIHVVLASDGAEALLRAEEKRPALVILEVTPERVGLEIARSLKADPKTRAIPVVASSFARGSRAEALAVGCDDFIGEPFSIEMLVAKVRQYLPLARHAWGQVSW